MEAADVLEEACEDEVGLFYKKYNSMRLQDGTRA